MIKNCKNCYQNFTLEADDFEFLKKFGVPEPTHCPDCRNQKRWAFRNDRIFYIRDCDMCKNKMITVYSPDKELTVYCRDCFLSDKFAPLEYGQDFDFNRSFFEQYEEMRTKVPRISMYQTQSENSDYTIHSGKNRNCYMANALRECENVYYSDFAQFCKDSMDLYMCSYLENSYFCTDSDQCYNSAYLENCLSVNFSYLCFDCRNSNNLLACVGLRRKEFMILNKPAAKEEFEATLEKLKTDADFNNEFIKKYKKLRLKVPVKYFWDKNSENCTGNYVVNSKNVSHSYNMRHSEDCRYCYDSMDLKDAMDITRFVNGEMVYEIHAAIDLNFSKFCNLCYQSGGMEYCDNSQSSHDCFGCVSLKNNTNCILNKQYQPEEYKMTLEKIKEHMKRSGEYGEFFPMKLSPFCYNEAKANDFYPLSKEGVLAKGLKWKDADPRQYQPQTYTIPENIKDVTDSICNEVLACENCGKNYKIIPQELKFYRDGGYSIPKKCSDCRHKLRISLQNPRKLWDRNCMKCGSEIKTTYAPERAEKVYCEKCYLNEIQ